MEPRGFGRVYLMVIIIIIILFCVSVEFTLLNNCGEWMAGRGNWSGNMSDWDLVPWNNWNCRHQTVESRAMTMTKCISFEIKSPWFNWQIKWVFSLDVKDSAPKTFPRNYETTLSLSSLGNGGVERHTCPKQFACEICLWLPLVTVFQNTYIQPTVISRPDQVKSHESDFGERSNDHHLLNETGACFRGVFPHWRHEWTGVLL